MRKKRLIIATLILVTLGCVYRETAVFIRYSTKPPDVDVLIPEQPQIEEEEPKENPTYQKQRYLIYYCDRSSFCGGFFDQLKGVFLGYVISRLTNRVFFIEMTATPCELTSYLTPNKVKWNNTIQRDVLAGLSKKRYNFQESRRLFKKIKTLDFNQHFLADVIYFRASLDYFDDLKLNPKYSQELAWMFNLPRDKIHRKLFFELFKISHKIDEKINNFLAVARPLTSSSNKLVCAHVRVGRSSTMPIDTELRSGPDDVKNVWRFLHKKVCEITQSCTLDNKRSHRQVNRSTAVARVYVSTDSYDVLNTARKEFRGLLMETNGPILHVEQHRDNELICDGIEKLLLDFMILSKCDVLMLSKSGLSRMAAYVRGGSNELYCNIQREGVRKCEVNKLRSLYRVLG